MNYSSKNTISQQKADGPSDFLGITQSSGLDHHAVYSRQRVDDFRENGVVSTQSARQHKDATDLVCQKAEAYAYLIRRLTPLECERLQGFPDGWTDIPSASDSARYKALGNSVRYPVWSSSWVGSPQPFGQYSYLGGFASVSHSFFVEFGE